MGTNSLNPASSLAVASGVAAVSGAALTATANPNVTAFPGDPTGTVLLDKFTDANPSAPPPTSSTA